MEFVKMEVGKKFPLEDILKHFEGSQGGASLSYNTEKKGLSLYIGLPNPTSNEVRDINSGVIRFALYPNEELSTSIVMIKFGMDLSFDLTFDINTLPADESGELVANGLDIYLIDTNTGVLKTMRLIGLGEDILTALGGITKNDGRYTTEEYWAWIKNNVYEKSVPQLWSESERIEWDR